MFSYLNASHIINNQRKAARDVRAGPVVAIVGPHDCGKTSLTKILLNYAIRSGWNPLLVELDVRHGLVTVPGTLSAVQVRRGSSYVIECPWDCCCCLCVLLQSLDMQLGRMQRQRKRWCWGREAGSLQTCMQLAHGQTVMNLKQRLLACMVHLVCTDPVCPSATPSLASLAKRLSVLSIKRQCYSASSTYVMLKVP